MKKYLTKKDIIENPMIIDIIKIRTKSKNIIKDYSKD